MKNPLPLTLNRLLQHETKEHPCNITSFPCSNTRFYWFSEYVYALVKFLSGDTGKLPYRYSAVAAIVQSEMWVFRQMQLLPVVGGVVGSLGVASGLASSLL